MLDGIEISMHDFSASSWHKGYLFARFFFSSDCAFESIHHWAIQILHQFKMTFGHHPRLSDKTLPCCVGCAILMCVSEYVRMISYTHTHTHHPSQLTWYPCPPIHPPQRWCSCCCCWNTFWQGCQASVHTPFQFGIDRV